MKLIIQIPCYNEEDTLEEVIKDLPRELDGVDQIEYLVIDDGCTDKTVEVARKAGVHHILSLGVNRGLAVAFISGLRRSVELGADIIVNTDGDHQYQGGSVKDVIVPILEGKAEIVVGTRPIDNMEYFSWTKKRLQRLGSRVVRQFSSTDIPDAASGFRAYSAEAALRLHVFNPYDYAVETIIQAGHMNMKIGHVPIGINPKTRESRLFPSMWYFVRRSISIMLRAYITYKPLRTFFYCSILPGVLVLFICLQFLYRYFSPQSSAGHIQSLILAAILLIMAFLLIVLGILADLISANRRLIHENLFQTRQLYKKSDTKPPLPDKAKE